MPAVRTPEASRPTRRIAVPRCSLPRRGIGSATSITFDFAALPCGAGLSIRSLAFRPATSLSTLRSGCYRHHAKLDTQLPGSGFPRPPSQATELNALARRNSLQTGCDFFRCRPAFQCHSSDKSEKMARIFSALASPATSILRPSDTCGPSPGFPVRGLLRPLRRPGPRGL